MADDALATHNEASPSQPGWPPETLEQRVHRLEDAVASLQDTRPLEDRITERVTERLQGRPPAPRPVSDISDKVMEPRQIPPPPVSPPPAPTTTPASLIRPVLTRQPWLLLDTITELRAMVRMFFDVHYHVGWSTRLTVLILLPVLLLSHWWLPPAWLPVVGWLFDKLVDLLLAFIIYKALSREAQRYLHTRAG
jgi:hypothetical protein